MTRHGGVFRAAHKSCRRCNGEACVVGGNLRIKASYRHCTKKQWFVHPVFCGNGLIEPASPASGIRGACARRRPRHYSDQSGGLRKHRNMRFNATKANFRVALRHQILDFLGAAQRHIDNQ